VTPIWEEFVSRAFKDRMFLSQFRGSVRSVMFKDSALAVVYDCLVSFFDEYKKTPSAEEYESWLRTLPPAQQSRAQEHAERARRLMNNESSFSLDVLIAEVVASVKAYMLGELLLTGSEMMDGGQVDFDFLVDRMKNILSVSIDPDMGMELGVNTESVIAKVQAASRFKYVTSGIEDIDRATQGGFGKKQLWMGMSPSGIGKSAFLVNMGAGAMISESNIAFLTCELSEEAFIDRFVRRVSKMTRSEIMTDPQKAGVRLGRSLRMSRSRVVVKYARAGTFAVTDLESWVDRMRMFWSFEPDIIVVDYLDEMRCNADDSRKDLRHQHSGITRSLRGMAIERDVACLSMTQTSKEALGQEHPTEAAIGEDYGKVKIADGLFALCQTEAELTANQMRFRLLKNRDGAGKGREVPLRMDLDRMLIEPLESKAYAEEEPVNW
jgi:hypothetical protein